MIDTTGLTVLMTGGVPGPVPLLLIHGAFSDYRMWEDMLQIAAGRYPVICPGLGGYFPARSVSDEFSADRHVEELLSFLIAAGVARVRIVGHSRGGRIALALAARAPHRVEALVLAEAGGVAEAGFFDTPPPTARDVAGLHAKVIALVRAGQREEALRRYLDVNQGAGTWERLPSILRRLMPDNVHTIYGTAGDKSCPLARSAVESVRCPILLLEGTASPPVFARVNDVIERVGARVQRKRFEGLDHFFPNHDPAGFMATIETFMEQVG